MIFFVIVPPDADRGYQRFMHDFHHDKMPRVVYVVPQAETQAWWEERPWCELLGYDEYDLRRIRQTILDEFYEEDIHVITRHDVALSRRLPRIKRLAACTSNDVAAMVRWIEDAAKAFVHGSISLRDRNKQVRDREAYIASPTLMNFYIPEFAINFMDAPTTLIDQHQTLSLLKAGHKNVKNYEFAVRGTINKESIDRDDAFALEKLHPGIVEAVDNGRTWNATCQWRRAYDPGC